MIQRKKFTELLMPSKVIRRVHYLERKTKSPDGVTFHDRSRVLIYDDDVNGDITSTTGVKEGDLGDDPNDPAEPSKPTGATYTDGPDSDVDLSSGTNIDNDTFHLSDEGGDGQVSDNSRSYQTKSSGVPNEEDTVSDKESAGVTKKRGADNVTTGVTEGDDETAGVAQEDNNSLAPGLDNAPVPR